MRLLLTGSSRATPLSWVIALGPVALRPRLTTGLPLFVRFNGLVFPKCLHAAHIAVRPWSGVLYQVRGSFGDKR